MQPKKKKKTKQNIVLSLYNSWQLETWLNFICTCKYNNKSLIIIKQAFIIKNNIFNNHT